MIHPSALLGTLLLAVTGAAAAAAAADTLPRTPSQTAARAAITLHYGPHERQAVALYPAAGTGRPPLAVYVHGGAWRAGHRDRVRSKPRWFNEAGWAFASVGYRVLPEAAVEDQARDLAEGLRLLRRDAAWLGYDPDRILLMGHSAGAHLAALVASDDRWLGEERRAIRGVILLDGAGYDVSSEFDRRGPLARKLYADAFGDDPQRQRALSPITHVDGNDPGEWLLVFAEGRIDAIEQAGYFGDALQKAGLRVERVPDPGNHLEINREFGDPGYRANDAVRAMMVRISSASSGPQDGS